MTYKPYTQFFEGLATRVVGRAFAPLVGLAMRGQSPVYVRGQKIALQFFVVPKI